MGTDPNLPALEIEKPDTNLPEVDIKAPSVEVDVKKGKKGKKGKKPKDKIEAKASGKIEVPEANVKTPEAEINAQAPSLGADFKLPKFGFKGKKADLDVKAGLPDTNLNADAKIEKPD